MTNRVKLQSLFESILGSRNVYFQPPESLKMKYPAIVYSLDSIDVTFASDDNYRKLPRYSVTVIDEDPDSKIIYKLLELKHCNFNRRYQADNLNHNVFTLYY